MKEEFNFQEFHTKVLKGLEDKLNYHNTLAKYTNQSVKLKKHISNIRFMEEVIKEYWIEQNEYNREVKI